MAQPERVIDYRIVQIVIDRFNMQEQQLSEKDEIGIKTSFSFQANFEHKGLRCISSYTFTKGEEKFIELTLSCVFAIKPEMFESLYDESKKHIVVEAFFCRYMATIAVGAARGVIASKVQDTLLQDVVLPPINLVETIKADSIFNVK